MAWITSCSGQAPLLRETRWPCADFYWHDAVLDSRASRRSVARARPSSRRVAGRHHALPDAPRAAASPANTRPAPHRPDHGPLRLMRGLLLRHLADRPVAHLHQTWLRWPRAHPSAPCHDPDLSRVKASSKPGAVHVAYATRLPRLQDYSPRRTHQGRSAGEANFRRPHNAGNRSERQSSFIGSLSSARGSACIVPISSIRTVCRHACANARTTSTDEKSVA